MDGRLVLVFQFSYTCNREVYHPLALDPKNGPTKKTAFAEHTFTCVTPRRVA